MSNSTNSTDSAAAVTCYVPDWYWPVGDHLFKFTYYYAPAVWFAFGLTGNVMFFKVFHGQASKEPGYVYQMYVAGSSVVEITVDFVYIVCIAMHGFLGDKQADFYAPWFVKDYFLMSYAAHVASPLTNSFVTSTFLLTVSAAMDRTLAIYMPLAYKNFNHKLHQRCSLAICMFLGPATSAFDFFRQMAEYRDGRYYIEYDDPYLKLWYVSLLSELRDVVRLIALIILIILNVLMVYLYKANQKKVASWANTAPNTKKKDSEKALTYFTLYESMSNAVRMVLIIAYYGLIFQFPQFKTCGRYLMVSVKDFLSPCIQAMSFYVFLLVNKRMRKIILSRKTHSTGHGLPASTAHFGTKSQMLPLESRGQLGSSMAALHM